MILATIAIAAAAYLLGSIPTGYLLVRIFRREDIRSVGSGNIGATNVLRAGGKGLGAATFLLDMLKGCAAVWLGGALGAWLMPTVPLRDAQALAAPDCRARPHVHLLAAFSRRQRRSHRLRRLPGRFALGCAGRDRRFSPCFSLITPLMFRWHPSPGRRPFRSLPGSSRPPARIRPSSSRSNAAVALLIVAKHYQNIRRLMAARHPPGSQENHMSRIAVLGSGAWGTALALSLCRRGGHQVTLWAHADELARQIAGAGENTQFLPGFPLPADLAVTAPMMRAIAAAEIVVSVIPSEFLRPTLLRVRARTCVPASCWSAPPRAWRTGVSCA